jgi:putative ABC transport system permease protein
MPQLRDLRHALRTLSSSPTLVVVATLSLGLGVGVNAALYSVFRTVFLQAPTAVAPERLVRIEPGNDNRISYPNVRDLAGGGTFEGTTAYAMVRLNLRYGEATEEVVGLMVSPTFFDVVELRPRAGRTFTSDVDSVVITDAFWRRRLNGRPDPLGASVVLNGHPFTVIGVLPEGHRAITGALGPDVYVPISEALAPGLADRRRTFLTLLARLRPGVSMEQTRAAVTVEAQLLEHLYPEENIGFGRPPYVFPIFGLGGWQTRDMSTTALAGITAVPFAIFGLVLLIACANVAGLLLARGATRRREIAIRLALGASRRHVVATLLAEAVVLSFAGSVLGLLLSWWLCGVLSTIPLPRAPGPLSLTLDVDVLGYALCLTVLVALASGLLPALASTRPQLSDAVKRDSMALGRRVTIRSILVSGQIAAATFLLFISILFFRSLSFIGEVDPGFSIDDLVTARIDLDQVRYAGDERLRFAAETMKVAHAVPGVLAASITSVIPLGGDSVSRVYQVEGKLTPRAETYTMNVGPGYFGTVKTRLQRGREFSPLDRVGGAPVAIVNEAFVKAHGLTPDPLGARVRDADTEPWLEIVGVVDDSKYGFFGEAPQPILCRPFLQTGGRLFVVARGSAAPGAWMPMLKEALARQDQTAIVKLQTMRDATSLESSVRRAGSTLLGAVGVLGLGLGLIGLYGLMAYTVTQRMRELGIRIALGASRRRVQGLVLRNAAVLVGVGLSVGTGLSILVTRPLAFLMSGVRVADPWTVALTAALFLATGLAASYIPSRRAARVDPMVALRSE